MADRREFMQALGAGAAALAAADGNAQAVPEADALAYLPATTLLQRFRDKKLSPVDVLEAQIQRIEALNGKVNCITHKHYAEARQAAKEAAARYRDGTTRPLDGITVAVKDDCEVKGWVVTMGSALLKDAPPAKEDGPFIELLRKAGAVLHIQTTTPEFYIWPTTATRLYGTTRNPWNLAYSPGGSSGGSGAALAAGFATLATGSDMGGSIRIPAALCGLYGFKAPFGRIPTSEIAYESYGPLARTFDDMNLMTQAIVGPHPLVHATLRPRLEFPTRYEDVKGWKLAVATLPGQTPLDPTVRTALDGAVKALEKLGCTVEPVDLGVRAADMDIFAEGLLSTATGASLTEAAQAPDKTSPYVGFVSERFKGKLGPKALAAADALTATLQRRVQQQVFGRGCRALIMPTLATPYLPAAHGMKPAEDTVRIDGKPAAGLTFTMTWLWNLLSRYPVVNVPIGQAPSQVPLGMQIVGNTFDDLAAFQLAAAYARVAPAFYSGKLFPDFRDQP